jgi:hypothetical protein
MNDLDLKALDEAIARAPNAWFILHHQRTDRWMPERASGVMKDVISGQYDDWKGPFDGLEIVRKERGKLEEPNKHNRTPALIQDQELAEKIERVRRMIKLGPDLTIQP